LSSLGNLPTSGRIWIFQYSQSVGGHLSRQSGFLFSSHMRACALKPSENDRKKHYNQWQMWDLAIYLHETQRTTRSRVLHMNISHVISAKLSKRLDPHNHTDYPHPGYRTFFLPLRARKRLTPHTYACPALENFCSGRPKHSGFLYTGHADGA